MELREVTRRTLSILACIPASWETIRGSAVISAADRFRVSTLQGAMPDSDIARALVAQHLGGWYAEVGFTPPYDTWPVRPSAFESASARTFTPRRLLQRVDAHIRKCLDSGELSELDDLADEQAPAGPPPPPDPRELQAMDAWFTRLRDEADVRTPLSQDSEDDWMPPLLTAGLSAYIAELGEAGQHLAVDQVRGRKPALHARLRRTLDERTEDEVHVAFRGIAHTHARAVQSRISAASTEAGLRAGGDKRTLVLIRNAAWPSGPVTARVVAELEEQGGIVVPISEDDLRTFAALEVMQRPQKPGFLEWLAARRPAGSTELFRRTLADVAPPEVAASPSPSEVTDAAPVADPALPPPAADPSPEQAAENLEPTAALPEPPARWRPSPVPRPRVATVPVGRSDTHQRDVHVPLESLRKHTVVFAGSGSGKTVLIRRLVEECALHGVSAIVLDPNNDLARLGDPWPEPPAHVGRRRRGEGRRLPRAAPRWSSGRPAGRRGGRLASSRCRTSAPSWTTPTSSRGGRMRPSRALAPRAKLTAAREGRSRAGRCSARRSTYYARPGRGSGLDGLHRPARRPAGGRQRAAQRRRSSPPRWRRH